MGHQGGLLECVGFDDLAHSLVDQFDDFLEWFGRLGHSVVGPRKIVVLGDLARLARLRACAEGAFVSVCAHIARTGQGEANCVLFRPRIA